MLYEHAAGQHPCTHLQLDLLVDWELVSTLWKENQSLRLSATMTGAPRYVQQQPNDTLWTPPDSNAQHLLAA